MASYSSQIVTESTLTGKCVALSLVLALGCTHTTQAQEEDRIAGMDVGVGVERFPNDDDGAGVTWQSLTLAPQISFSKLSLGFAAKVRFRFDGGANGTGWEIREDDWSSDFAVPGRSFLDLFLPIVRFANYGAEGDPLVVRVGSFDYSSLGSGFLVGDYSNMSLLPQRRLFGVDLDLDGEVFNFPAVGLETVVGHIPALDLVGGRVWVRPLHALGLPLLSSLQFGVTAAADFDPFRYASAPVDQANVSAFGFDVVVPVVSTPAFSAKTYADGVLLGTSEAESRLIGTALGVSGTAIGLIRYGFQLRFTEDGFLPVYFGRDYDRLRVTKYQVLRDAEQASQAADALEGLVHAGWVARVGTSLLERRIELDLGLSGPLTGERGALAGIPYAQLSGLEVQGRIGIRNVGIEGLSFGLDYHKRQLDGLNDITNPEHLSLGTTLSYRAGNTGINFSYRGHYDPAAGGLAGAPVLESWIKLF